MGLLYDEGLGDYMGKLAYGEQPNMWDRVSAAGAIADLTPWGLLAGAAAIPAKAGLLALPNPAAKKVANAVAREDAWQALEKASKNAGVKRSKSTGRYVGGPADVTSPQKRTPIVKRYDERTQRAIDAGIPPGYFYDQGRKELARITDTPEDHYLAAMAYGPTSTQVGPYQNTNYAIRAFDQQAMGAPTSVGLYPNNLRRNVDSALYGEDPWKGYKVDRYSYLLGPKDEHANPLQLMPPNDQWEGFGTGFAKGKVPGNATQVAWADDIRERALERMNRRRAEQGLRPLTREEMQELHWAAIRAETEGRPLELTDKDTLQGSLPYFRMQHAWEAEPGGTSGLSRLTSKEDYADEVYGLLSDEQGKDRVIRAMGGRLQEPIVSGTGVWKGATSPGFQSRSYVSHTAAGGLDPASKARVDATEAVRQYMLGQEGRAYNLLQPTTAASKYDIADILTGQTPSPEDTLRLQGMLDEPMPRDLPGGGVMMESVPATVVPTAEGYRVVGHGDSGQRFMDSVSRLSDSPVYGRNIGGYAEYDWEGGKATEGLLKALESSKLPGPGRLADSPETRQIAGEMADLYRRLDAEGKLKQNQRLTDALEAWKTQGLDGLRALVAQGLAPAALLAIFASGAGGLSPAEQSSS